MTPAELRERREALHAAGVALRRRPACDTLRALEQVLESWRDPGSAWRRALEAQLPAATGYSAQNVRAGLELGLEHWTGAALRALVERELGGAERLDATAPSAVRGFDTTAVLLAGSIPMPTLLALLAPLALRSPVLAKCAARDPITAPLVARSIAEVDAALGRCIEVLQLRRGESDCLRALLEADCVVATGSDEAVAEIAAQVRPPRRLVAYGHRLSVAALAGEATRGERLERAADALARDVALWDQLGCLSPIALYVVDGDTDSAERAAHALARALEALESRWPLGRVESAAAAAIAHERGAAELREAAGHDVRVHASNTARWTVIREADAAPRPAPLHRFVRVHPVRGSSGLLAALAHYAPHLAAVALEGFDSDDDALPRALAALGASRLCRFGAMQAPPLDWHHDGCGVLTPLARYTDYEL